MILAAELGAVAAGAEVGTRFCRLGGGDMRVKMTLTFPGETIEELRTFAKSEGFLSANILARYLIMRGLRTGTETEIREANGKKTYALEVEDSGEIEIYCRAKRLGSVANFAGFAMEQYMTRYPLKKPQKSAEGGETPKIKRYGAGWYSLAHSGVF
jgi:hypothetical protein